MFHYYPHKSGSYKPSTSVRLGSFNIFRLSETKFKRLDWVAELIDETWDVLAVSEIQHNRALSLELSLNAVRALKEEKIDLKTAKETYDAPRYIELLLELQKRDPSWGLILAPSAQGSDSELFGYFYRYKKVKPVESAYCAENYGKLKDIKLLNWLDSEDAGGFSRRDEKNPLIRPYQQPKKAYACQLALKGVWRDYFNKIPLTARFESKNFNFNYITLHLKFRANETSQGKCKTECQKAAEDMMNEMGASEETIREVLEGGISSGEAKYLARFFEATSAVRAAADIAQWEEDKDVIIAGDFNLDYEEDGYRGRLWKNVVSNLAGAKVLVKEKTSLSNRYGYGNNYDHFILSTDNGASDECDPTTAKPEDFIAPDFFMADKFEYYLDPKNFDQIIDDELTKLENAKRIDSEGQLTDLYNPAYGGKFKVCTELKDSAKIPSVGMSFIDGIINDLKCQILYQNEDLPDSIQKTIHPKLAQEPYKPYTFLMSDHLPISMACSTTQSGGKEARSNRPD